METNYSSLSERRKSIQSDNYRHEVISVGHVKSGDLIILRDKQDRRCVTIGAKRQALQVTSSQEEVPAPEAEAEYKIDHDSLNFRARSSKFFVVAHLD